MSHSFGNNSRPELISKKAFKNINKVFQIGQNGQVGDSGKVGNIQVVPEWGTNLNNFYVNYVQPNIFPIIVMILIIIFLSIKYNIIKPIHIEIKKYNGIIFIFIIQYEIKI